MRPTLPPRRTLLLLIRSGERRRGKVYEGLAHKKPDTPGSYAEDESRLSDISLQWMVEQARSLPHPIIIDPSKLNLFPSPVGLQHSEAEKLREGYPWWIPKKLRHLWKEEPRAIEIDAILHSTVHERYALPGVLQYGLNVPYRPENLRSHEQIKHYY